MSHTIYKTDAFVLGSVPRGEASAVFSLFTENHGLIAARAQSVRRGNAKLKHALNRYHKASCSLVAGKLGWRLIDAQELSLPDDLLTSVIKREVYAKILLLVARFQGQEEEGKELYNDIIAMINFLGNNTFNTADKESLEIAVALSLLHRFGYLSQEDVLQEIGEDSATSLFNPHAWEQKHFVPLQKNTRPLIALINNGIAASNL